ncbi:MAG: glycosyltransferase family 2 protein [Acidobacteriia bacterium]|nr:glycosyltransferase family 2 protein [Terriglobia bacterium]
MAATTTDITTLSVIIPAYNELRTIATVIARVNAVDVHGLRKEIIVVDDGSTDGTRDVLEGVRREGRARVILQPANRGKGAAVRTGLEAATGDLVIIQDADLELSPEEYPRLVAPFLEDPSTQAVFGSRFLSGAREGRPLAVFANRFLTSLTNLLYGASLTDMETCYKLCRTPVLKGLALESDRFEIEPEITSKLLRHGCTIREVAISYQPRTRADGKTINWRDGVRAIMTLIKWRLVRKV